MRHVINYFVADYTVILLTYRGNSLDDYINVAHTQLEGVPDGSVALCYSMGAQIARGVAARRPQLFRRVVFLSGVERIGIRLAVCCKAIGFMLIPMLRTLIGRPLMLDTAKQVSRVFLHPLPAPQPSEAEASRRRADEDVQLAQQLMKKRLLPEPAWPMLRLFLPGLRLHFPPLPCPILAVVPNRDFLLPGATYPGEQTEILRVNGDHASFIRERPPSQCLSYIATWLQAPVNPTPTHAE
jgi:pimeloyl-ACP methyl ester carboxylesterase